MKDNSEHSEGGEVPKLTKALEVARTLPCACPDCGMRETESAKKILEFAESLTATGSVVAPKPDEWYTENEMYQWLITQKYSEEIAKELSTKWAADLQWSFNKGFKKGSDFITKSELVAKKDKEIRGDRMIVDLEHDKTVLTSENERLSDEIEGYKKILKEIEFQVYGDWPDQEKMIFIKMKFPKR
jgi:uncharacterized protein YaaN involved in tellurite resistance